MLCEYPTSSYALETTQRSNILFPKGHHVLARVALVQSPQFNPSLLDSFHCRCLYNQPIAPSKTYVSPFPSSFCHWNFLLQETAQKMGSLPPMSIASFTTNSTSGGYCGEFEILENGDCVIDDSVLSLSSKSKLSIGRSTQNTLVLNHFSISSTHCMIWVVLFDDNSVPLVYLKDMSLNGTYVNDEKLMRNQVVLLNHGDLVTIPHGVDMEFHAAYGTAEGDICKELITDKCIKREIDHWRIKDRVLGNGTFGHVFACENTKDPRLFAVKVVKKNTSSVPFEAKMLSKLDHPNIIKVYHTHYSVDYLYIFEDLITGGDLFSYLSDGTALQAISEFEGLVITYQIMKALKYLHKNNIVHRDLKLDNILLESPYPFTRIILADFGIAKSISTTKRRLFTTVGTPEYCAPEVGFEHTKIPPHMRKGIFGKSGSSTTRQGYDYKCDIWSLGIIVHIMLSGVSPFFEDGDEVNIVRAAKRGILKLNESQWLNVPVAAKDYVQSLLYVDMGKRLDIDGCFEHTWIKRHTTELIGIYDKIISGCTGTSL